MTDTHTTPAEACRMIAAEVRAASATFKTEINEASAILLNCIGPLREAGDHLRQANAHAAAAQDHIASALDDLAADLDTPREQLITNLSAAVELLTPAEDARIRALATVQALHADGMISDTAAAALNKSLETPDAVEGT